MRLPSHTQLVKSLPLLAHFVLHRLWLSTMLLKVTISPYPSHFRISSAHWSAYSIRLRIYSVYIITHHPFSPFFSSCRHNHFKLISFALSSYASRLSYLWLSPVLLKVTISSRLSRRHATSSHIHSLCSLSSPLPISSVLRSGPVRFFCLFWTNRNRNRLPNSEIQKKPDRNRKQPV